MTQFKHHGLPAPVRAVMMHAHAALATVALLCVAAPGAYAQQAEAKRDDLDVTMHVIVDPDAKLPDEVVRRIPLPAPKPASQSAPSGTKEDTQPDAAAKGQQRAAEARELGREMSERAKERAQEAAEQREQARRARDEERRRNPDPPNRPPERPDPPQRP